MKGITITNEAMAGGANGLSDADRVDVNRAVAARERSLVRYEESREYREAVERAADIYVEGVAGGRRGLKRFEEALGTPEFSGYLGDVLQRVLLPSFQAWIPPIRQIVRTGTFNDLTRDKKQFQFGGGDQPLERIGEFGPYPVRGRTSREFAWAAYKYGADYEISWEMALADDLNALREFPGVMASAARNSEALAITRLYVDSSGPHASLYSVPNNNLGTAALSVESLAEGLTAMAQHTDPDTGVPIFNRPRYLVVGPELEITARQILESPLLTYGGQTTGMPVGTVNVVSKYNLELIVNPWHRYVAGENAEGAWFLFSDPNSGPMGPGLAAIEFDTLRGAETPILLRRRGQFLAVGGGDDPRGDLSDVDTSGWRVVYPHGGGQLFPQATYASTGAGDGS